MEEVMKRLEQEKTSALDEAATLRKSLSELENNTASRCTQSNNTITALQTVLEELEREISEKNDALQRLTASIDNQSISKSEMDQILSEKEQKVSGLTSELESCNKRLGEIQEQLALKIQECEQLTIELKQQQSIAENEKKVLVEQLQQTQMQCTKNGNVEQEMMEKLHSLKEDNEKYNLVRTSSRESLTPLGESEPLGAPSYDPPSDIESEAEEPPGSAESLSKDQLLHRLLQVESSLGKYRGKYSELVTAYRTVQRDKEKTQAILSQSQDKALCRIGELREELQMDQQAKKHLQDEFDAALEEKDQMITVLQTQVSLLKKRVKGVSDGTALPEGEVSLSEDSNSAPKSPPNEQEAETEVTEEGGNSDPSKLMEALQKRVKRQENLLQKCKEVLRTHKERSAQLGSENETLQEQLQERLQELEKMKELHTTEKTKLINQLRDAKNHIKQLEQDKGMVIAETKRQMHETLEMKEEEIAQLRSRLQQTTTQKEEVQEQKERVEKSAFEELERALSAAQKSEEARRQLQVQLEEQVKEVERPG
uniref:Uncharacterized protein n=1 Tax=Knipowitschia caucasica TaxID=637954 RepID=A0AAV2M4M6_KNICA